MAGSDIGTLLMRVNAETQGFETGMENSKKSMSMLKAGVIAGGLAIGASLVAMGAKGIALASDAQEVQNKFDVVFGSMKEDTEEWASSYASAVGRSRNDTKKFLADQQDVLTGLGLSTETAGDFSKEIVSLGVDLASFQNMSDEDAMNRLSSALRGSSDSAAGFGADISVATLKNSEYFKSLGKTYEELSQVEKMQLRLAVITAQSGNAIGDAERSAGGYANQLKALQSNIKDAGTDLGALLIPVATAFVSLLNEKVMPIVGDFVAFMSEKMPMIQEVTSKTFGVIGDVMGTVIDIISDFLLPIFTQFSDDGGKSLESIEKISDKVFKAIKMVADDVYKFFNDNILPVFKSLSDLWVEIAPIITGIVETLFESMLTVTTSLYKFYRDNFLPILESFFKFVNDNMPQIQSIMSSAFNVIKNSIEIVTDIFTMVLLPTMQTLFDFVKPSFPIIGSIIKTAFNVVIDIVDSAFRAFDGLVGIIKKAIDFLGQFNKKKSDTDLSSGKYGSQGLAGDSGVISGQRAYGGSVEAGKSYLVNERGNSEIFTPSSNGTISTGGNNVVININGAGNTDEIMNKVIRALNSQGIKTR